MCIFLCGGLSNLFIKALRENVKLHRNNCSNGFCYITEGLKDYLHDNHGMKQIHGKPAHPQTQGKIERYHRTMKNVVKLHHYYSPEELQAALEVFVNRYNCNLTHLRHTQK